MSKVQEWALNLLYNHDLGNRRVRRAARKIEREHESKLRGYAAKGSKRAAESLAEWQDIVQPKKTRQPYTATAVDERRKRRNKRKANR